MTRQQLDQLGEIRTKHPDWGTRRLAEALGVNRKTVQAALKAKPVKERTDSENADALRKLLSRGPASLDQLRATLEVSDQEIGRAIELLSRTHALAWQADNLVLDRPAFGRIPLSFVNSDSVVRIGLVADTHLACREERLDALHAQYDLFQAEKITTVLHAGNIVDGYVPKHNGTSVLCTGVDQQCQYVVDNYPAKKGITTYFITGDDHESSFMRDGLNFGWYLQKMAEAAGRQDLVYIGHIESDVDVTTPSGVIRIKVQHPGGGSAYSRSYAAQKQVECVPLDTEILTKKGWKKPDELVVGEEVLGYDIESDMCVWTPLLGVNFGLGSTVRFYNDQFSVVCTPEHRWAQEIEQRAGPNKNSRVPSPYSRKYREIAPIGHTKRRARVIQTAKAPDGPGLPEFSYKDFLRRPLAPSRVMEMTGGERRSFIEGLLIAEGSRCHVEGRTHEQVVFSQNAGPVLEAFRLACFLEGIATTARNVCGGSLKPEVTHHYATTVSTKRMRICNRLKTEPVGYGPVWCPSTGTGTWVMRQGRTITITGNSLQGGEKPQILVQGHYHVANYMVDRNVHVINLPGFQDQTIFARKKRLRMEVGGAILTFRVTEASSVSRVSVEFNMFFDRGFYKPFLRSDVSLLKGHLTIRTKGKR